LLCKLDAAQPAAPPAALGGGGGEDALGRLLRDFDLDPAEMRPLLAGLGVAGPQVAVAYSSPW
jgi:hypothetical protein